MRIRIATRGSRLSLIQTEIIMNMIRRVEPNVQFDVIIVKTTGDIVQDKHYTLSALRGFLRRRLTWRC